MSQSITSYIRKSRLAVSAILFVFLGGYLFPYLSEISQNIFTKSKLNVGIVAGYPISYYPDYRSQFDFMLRQEIEIHGHYEGIEAIVHKKVWEKFILSNAFKNTFTLLGLNVCEEEREEMFLGNDIPESVKEEAYFQDDKMEKFDKGKYLNYLKYLSSQPGGVMAWKEFEKKLILYRFQSKLSFLIRESMHRSKVTKKVEKELEKPISVQYLFIPYGAILDSQVRKLVSEEDIKAYYKAHQKEFIQEESKDIEYVVFQTLPSSDDMEATLENLKALNQSFAKSSRAEDFAKLNSDNPDEVLIQLADKDLPDYMRREIEKPQKKETVIIGPVKEGNKYILYRYKGVISTSFLSNFFGKKEKVHQLFKIERVITVNKDNNYNRTEATNFSKQVKNMNEWKKVAEEIYGLSIYKATIPLSHAVRIGEGKWRKLIRWLYNDAKLALPSPVIELNNGSCLVAIMTKKTKEGSIPFTEVKNKIERELFNNQKAALILDQIATIDIEKISLDEIVEKYGKNASTYEVKTLYFEDNEIAKGHYAPHAIGAAFSLEVGEKTPCIKDKNGIYILLRMPLYDDEKAKKKKLTKKESEKNRFNKEAAIINKFILNHKIKIEDWRYRFYD